MQIKARETCEICGGSGVILSLSWKEYYEEHNSEYHREVKVPDEPEAKKCDGCAGEGCLEFWIELRELKILSRGV